MNDCYNLKDRIDERIQEGKLMRFVTNYNEQRPRRD
jgi:hypothetical protein